MVLNRRETGGDLVEVGTKGTPLGVGEVGTGRTTVSPTSEWRRVRFQVIFPRRERAS